MLKWPHDHSGAFLPFSGYLCRDNQFGDFSWFKKKKGLLHWFASYSFWNAATMVICTLNISIAFYFWGMHCCSCTFGLRQCDLSDLVCSVLGMFQRLDKLRKNAFASVILFGTNNDSSISGIWVFRGQDLAFTVCHLTTSVLNFGIIIGLVLPKAMLFALFFLEKAFCLCMTYFYRLTATSIASYLLLNWFWPVPFVFIPINDHSCCEMCLFTVVFLFQLSEDWQIDYESYNWRKLDVDSEECKTMVKEYFAWEGEFKHVGKPFSQGKIFKWAVMALTNCQHLNLRTWKKELKCQVWGSWIEEK